MHRRCTVCGHQRLAWINEQLRGKPNLLAIARETGLHRMAITRHRDTHPLDQTEPIRVGAGLGAGAAVVQDERSKRKYVKKARKPVSVQSAKDVFLGAFKVSGDLNAAADAAAVTRLTVQKWLEHDEQFSLQYNQARAELVENLEATAIERARTGGQFVRKVYRAGQLIEEVHEWRPSDAALIKLLSSLKPEVYGEKIAITQTSIVKAVDMQAWAEV